MFPSRRAADGDRKQRHAALNTMAPARRFPPPWSVEETDACFIVKDQAGHSLAYVYFEEEQRAYA